MADSALYSFETFGNLLDKTLLDYSREAAVAMQNYVQEPLLLAVTCWVLVTGLLIANGMIRKTIPEFLYECVIVFCFSAIGLSMFTYIQWVIEFGGKLDQWIMLPLSDDSGSVWAALDHLWSSSFDIVKKLFNLSVDFDFTDLATSIFDALVFFGLIVLVAIGVVFLTNMAVMLLVANKIILTIMLGLGPLFFALAAFRVTRSFFEGWLKTCLTAIFTFVILGAALSFISDIIGGIVQAIENIVTIDGEDYKIPNGLIPNLMELSLIFLIICLSVTWMFKWIPLVVHNITGGLAGAAGPGFIGAAGQAASTAARTMSAGYKVGKGIATATAGAATVLAGAMVSSQSARYAERAVANANVGADPNGSTAGSGGKVNTFLGGTQDQPTGGLSTAGGADAAGNDALKSDAGSTAGAEGSGTLSGEGGSDAKTPYAATAGQSAGLSGSYTAGTDNSAEGRYKAMGGGTATSYVENLPRQRHTTVGESGLAKINPASLGHMNRATTASALDEGLQHSVSTARGSTIVGESAGAAGLFTGSGSSSVGPSGYSGSSVTPNSALRTLNATESFSTSVSESSAASLSESVTEEGGVSSVDAGVSSADTAINTVNSSTSVTEETGAGGSGNIRIDPNAAGTRYVNNSTTPASSLAGAGTSTLQGRPVNEDAIRNAAAQAEAAKDAASTIANEGGTRVEPDYTRPSYASLREQYGAVRGTYESAMEHQADAVKKVRDAATAAPAAFANAASAARDAFSQRFPKAGAMLQKHIDQAKAFKEHRQALNEAAKPAAQAQTATKEARNAADGFERAAVAIEKATGVQPVVFTGSSKAGGSDGGRSTAFMTGVAMGTDTTADGDFDT